MTLSDLRQTIAELREMEKCATPCPWYVSSRGLDRDNEVANVRGVLIGGPRSAISCGDEAVAIVALRNHAPRLLDVLSKALDVVEQAEELKRDALNAHNAAIAVAKGIQEIRSFRPSEPTDIECESLLEEFKRSPLYRSLSAFHKSLGEGEAK